MTAVRTNILQVKRLKFDIHILITDVFDIVTNL